MKIKEQFIKMLITLGWSLTGLFVLFTSGVVLNQLFKYINY